MKVVYCLARTIILSSIIFFNLPFLENVTLVAHAQDISTNAYMRITQATYRTLAENQTALEADIFVDGHLMLEAVDFPFTTEYLTLSHGIHSINLVTKGNAMNTGQSTEMTLVAGHHYDLVAYGDFAGVDSPVTFIPIDETTLTADKGIETGKSALILVDLLDDPTTPLDFYFGNKLIIENLAHGSVAAVSLPLEPVAIRVTPTGDTNTTLVEVGAESGLSGLPYTIITSIRIHNLHEPGILRYSSSLPIGDWLRAVSAVDAQLSGAEQIMEVTGLHDKLNGIGPFTIFAPVDLEAAQKGKVSPFSDPALLDALANNHIVGGRYLPHELIRHETLMTLQGSELSFKFHETNSGYWEINGSVPIWTDYLLGNGVLYTIDGILTLSKQS